MTNPLDEGAIPSTSTINTNQLLKDEELEVETYIYEDSRLVLIEDSPEAAAVQKE
jgi:hypothetical protein